jgi:hypothetical protein
MLMRFSGFGIGIEHVDVIFGFWIGFEHFDEIFGFRDRLWAS